MICWKIRYPCINNFNTLWYDLSRLALSLDLPFRRFDFQLWVIQCHHHHSHSKLWLSFAFSLKRRNPFSFYFLRSLCS